MSATAYRSSVALL